MFSRKYAYFSRHLILPVKEEYAARCKGAFLESWVKFRNDDYIEDLVRFYIEEAGWRLGEALQPPRLTHRQDFLENAFQLSCFEEAQQYGYSTSFHAWSERPADPDAFIRENNLKRNRGDIPFSE